MSPGCGHVFWLFGLSGAGKSTLAGSLADALRAGGTAVLALDGDRLRAGLCQGLGFSDADRMENLRRAAETARLGADSGLCVIAAFITPHEDHRVAIARIVGPDCLSWIFLDAPLEVCRRRDVKGLYARAAAGQVAQMTGLSSSFDPPARADLVVPTAREDIARSSARLFAFARSRLGPRPA